MFMMCCTLLVKANLHAKVVNKSYFSEVKMLVTSGSLRAFHMSYDAMNANESVDALVVSNE